MPWQLAVSLFIAGNVATNLVKRNYSQKSSAPATFPPALSYVLGVAPLGIVAGLLLPHEVNWSWWLGFLYMIEASSVAIANWLGFKAIKLLPLAPYQTVSLFTNVTVIFLGWALLGEVLTSTQLLGGMIIIAAAIVAIWAPVKSLDSIRQKVHIKAVSLALVSAFTLGIALITQKAVLGHMEIGGELIFGWSIQTLAMLLLASKDISYESIRRLTGYEIRWSTFMGLANGIAGVFYVVAIVNSDNISLISALSALSLPLIVLGAHFILKEHDNSKLMWLSILTGFVGLLIVGL